MAMSQKGLKINFGVIFVKGCRVRSIFIFIFAILAGCASSGSPNITSGISTVTDERRAELAKEDFDTCQLKTPEETWAYWNIALSEEDKERVKSTPYGDLILFHHSWGMGIRNGFCLWKGGPLQNWFNERGVSHPDSMSQLLIELYWSHLNGCNPQIDAFTRTDNLGNPELLRCPPGIDISAPDYREEKPEIDSDQ